MLKKIITGCIQTIAFITFRFVIKFLGILIKYSLFKGIYKDMPYNHLIAMFS